MSFAKCTSSRRGSKTVSKPWIAAGIIGAVAFGATAIPLPATADNPGHAQPSTFGLLTSKYDPMFTEAGERYGVPPLLLAAVAKVESGFDANARSDAGAVGLMQFTRPTASQFGIDPTVPKQAIDGAARKLSRDIKRFGSVELGLAAYNAGEGAVDKYDGIPPFPETRAYVVKVTKAMDAAR